MYSGDECVNIRNMRAVKRTRLAPNSSGNTAPDKIERKGFHPRLVSAFLLKFLCAISIIKQTKSTLYLQKTVT